MTTQAEWTHEKLSEWLANDQPVNAYALDVIEGRESHGGQSGVAGLRNTVLGLFRADHGGGLYAYMCKRLPEHHTVNRGALEWTRDNVTAASLDEMTLEDWTVLANEVWDLEIG